MRMKGAILTFAVVVMFSVMPAHADMVGDNVSSILHTAFAGSWSGGPGPEAAGVGPGAEFDRTFFSGQVDLSLDIDGTSFTLTYINNLPGTENNPDGDFNLGLDGFEFTDLAQHFTGIIPGINTFPAGSVTGTSVTDHTIQIFMNEPIIPGQGTTWVATWNVEFGPVTSTPEPSSLLLLGSGFLGIAGIVRRKLPV